MNTTQDRVFAFLALLVFGWFVGVLVYKVIEIDLWIVCAAVMLMATYDFWITAFFPRNGGPAKISDDLESRPQGVSGKTLTSSKDMFDEET